MFSRCVDIFTCLLVCGWLAMPCSAEDFHKQFFKRYCTACHGNGASEGDFSVAELLGNGDQREHFASLERAFRQLSKNKMPPEEAEQPTAVERKQMLSELKSYLDKVVDDRGARFAGAFSRRLNREELQNDLFDTLQIDRRLYGLQPFVSQLPEEARNDGFDTVGYGLGQSALLLTQYQQFVDRYLALATDNEMQSQRWRFKFGTRYLQENKTQFDGLGYRTFAYTHNTKEGQINRSIPAFDVSWALNGQDDSPHQNHDDVDAAFKSFFPNASENNQRGQLDLHRQGGLPLFEDDCLVIATSMGMRMRPWPLSVATTGKYKIRMRCRLRFTEGVSPEPVFVQYFNRSHHFIGRIEQRELVDEATYSFDEDQPRLCFENPKRYVRLPVDEWTTIEFDDFRSTSETYDATQSGFTFDFRFESKAQRKTRRAPRDQPAKNGKPEVWASREEIEAHYPFLVEVDYLEVEGPYPLVSERSKRLPASPTDGNTARARAEDCLRKLLPSIYRTPLNQADLDLHLDIFDRNLARTNDFGIALRATLSAAYLSPKHLFLSSSDAECVPGTALPDHELATRLSLFLWSSTPDEELRSLANRGKLRDLETLKQQTQRLLKHRYASELSANFASQWLHLYNIGLNEPDADLYSYDKHLERGMIHESLRFFHEILKENGSIQQFLDSDWILVNERLANIYQYKLTGEEIREPFSSWRKVAVSDLPNYAGVRGGLLGQASILKLTSGSIRTSIVSRGMFILENILDDPPAPPPENVGEIANAVADLDQKSVREQLEIHRNRKTCNACHKRIDPLGFALENYGVLGQWRTSETDGMKPLIKVEETIVPFKGGTRLQRKTTKVKRQGHPVDTKAVVMGVAVDGPSELRELLLSQDSVFARCFVQKMMTYALGRRLRYQDEAEIDEIVAKTKQDDYRLQDIIKQIVVSDSFRTY